MAELSTICAGTFLSSISAVGIGGKEGSVLESINVDER
jgi:hypothetical protein